LLFSTFCLPLFAASLSEIERELQKISEIKKQGSLSAELIEREASLRKEKATLSEGKRGPAFTPTKRLSANLKHNQSSYLDPIRKMEKDEEKIAAIFSRLVEERELLAKEIEGGSKNPDKIEELRNKIDLLEWKKSIVQKRMSERNVANNNSSYKVSGLIDFYYARSSNKGGNNGTSDRTQYHNTLRYYDNKHNDFTVNLAEVTLSGTKDRTSFLIDLDFGEFAEQNAPGNEISKHIGQGTITYDIDGRHSVSAGKMYTHVGYELAKPVDNWNYSRPFAFGYGIPFWHEGVAVKGSYESGFRWATFFYDRTDAHISNSQDKSYGLQLGYINANSSLLYNGITGPDQNGKEDRKRTVHNINGQLNVSGSLSFAFDWVHGTDDNATGVGNKDQKWQSLVGYVNWKFDDKWRFAARSEWFAETTNAGESGAYRLGVDGSVTGPVDITTQTMTLAHAFSEGNELRLEYRLDHANNGIFWNRDNHLRRQQDTMLIAWMFKI
jgi:hypothetical protein